VATVLHLAPHPDDEVLGAPGTLLALRRAGHRVVNLACSLGRPAQQARRRAEVTEACHRAGFELLVQDPPLAISGGDDLDAAGRTLVATVDRLVRDLRAALVVAPSPDDGHHGHRVVGRAALRALARDGAPPVWLWALWGALPRPTLYVPVGEELVAEAEHALAAHAGELERNDYAALLRARATVAAVQGAELLFGFGAAGRGDRYAELLTELRFADGWADGSPRALEPADPLRDLGR
jgi:LmbE family N-acetylglucosaminyl deacetylase